ncbi:hypothetical protein PLESTF_000200600 [Pleodorina starrii]|nr:hypothetical protein PLESTF_000200600 [Pleodorina starrii]
MPPLTQTASEALWGRSFTSTDASTSGRSSQITSSQRDDDDVVVLLSDETAASEAAPLVSHNAVKLAVCGGVSGAFAKTCTAPLARLTILYQVKGLAVAGAAGAGGQQLGVFAALRHIAATEGLTALWKGNLITIMHRIPYSSTNFFTYESTKRALQGRLQNESARSWAAGAVSGLVACTAAYPLDLLRTRIAAETPAPHCSTSTSGTSGSAAACGPPHQVLRRQHHHPHHPHPDHPQPHPHHHHHHPQQPSYRRVPSALRRILAEQGVRGLYKGLGATLVQVVPGLAFNFCFYDTFKRLALRQQAPLAGQQQQQPLQPLRHQQQQQGDLLLETPPASPSPSPSQEQQPGGLGPGQGPQQPASSCCQQSLHKIRQPEQQQQQQQAPFHEQWDPQVTHYPQEQQQQPRRQQAATGGSCSGSGGGGGARGSGSCNAGEVVAAPPLPSASPSPLTSAVCACLSGLCTSSLTFPLDVVRRRLQVYEHGALGRLRYLDVVRAVYSEGGAVAFYRGLGPELLKVLPGMAIAFSTYETMKRLTGAA